MAEAVHAALVWVAEQDLAGGNGAFGEPSAPAPHRCARDRRVRHVVSKAEVLVPVPVVLHPRPTVQQELLQQMPSASGSNLGRRLAPSASGLCACTESQIRVRANRNGLALPLAELEARDRAGQP